MRTDLLLELTTTVMIKGLTSYLLIVPPHENGTCSISAEFSNKPAGRYVLQRMMSEGSLDPLEYGRILEMIEASDLPEEGHEILMHISPLTAAAYHLLNEGDPEECLPDYVGHCHHILEAAGIPFVMDDILALSIQVHMPQFTVDVCVTVHEGQLILEVVDEYCTHLESPAVDDEIEIPDCTFAATLNIPNSPVMFVSFSADGNQSVWLESVSRRSARQTITEMNRLDAITLADADKLRMIVDGLSMPANHRIEQTMTPLSVLAMRAMGHPFEYLLLQFIQYEGLREEPDFTTIWDRAWDLWRNPLQHDVKLIIHSEPPEQPDVETLMSKAGLWGGGALTE